LTEILKQKQYRPIPVEKQVLIIFAATNGFLDDLSVDECRRFEEELYKFVDTQRPQVTKLIRDKKQIDADTKAVLIEALKDFKLKFSETGKK